MPVLRHPIGTHVKAGQGLVAGARAQADAVGCEAVQIFVGNAPYLVNLGSPAPETVERSVAVVAHHLARAAVMGAEGVVGAVAELIAHPATAGVPFILETPGSRDPGHGDIRALRAIRDVVAAR